MVLKGSLFVRRGVFQWNVLEARTGARFFFSRFPAAGVFVPPHLRFDSDSTRVPVADATVVASKISAAV